jgi:superfamily II DNA or RNA helicase
MNLTFSERGKYFEWLCKFYLKIHPIYKVTYKDVLHSSEFQKDRKIMNKLGLDKNEEGTDLLGITFDNRFEIIQCKYKNNKNKNLEAKDVEAALRVAGGKNASKWVDSILMCSNRQGLSKNKNLTEQQKFQIRALSAGDFESLNKNDFKNIKKVIDDAIPIYESKSPRKHQKKAIKAIQNHFKENNRGQLIHACGTGKTLTSYFTFRDIKPRLTLFVVPSLQLINQTLIEWSKESLADKSPISPLVVCSDTSNEKISEHDPQLWLQELGIKVSNNADDLKKFLSSRRKNKVIFSTYQSGKVLANHLAKLGKTVDLAFFDEAHNTATSKSKLFGYLLSDKNISIRKRLFMTATPKKLVGKDDRFLSMDDVNTYGEVIDEITVKDAIEDLKLLNDYKIVTQLVDDASVKKLLKDNPFVIDKKRLPEEAELKLISSAITLKKAIKDKKIKNIVSFHGRVNRARAFQKGLNNILREQNVNTYHVNGSLSGTVRQGILEDFASNPPSLVTNAQCLSEGVNVPSIDAVMFVDPKQSRVDITQAIGRALRKGGKEKGDSYIIVPIVINKKNSNSIDEAYQQILMVLRSMSEHDGRIVESYKLIAQGKKPIRNFLEIDTEYFPEEFDLKEFTETLNIKAWSRFSRLGRRPFEQAREWARGLGINSVDWKKFSKTNKKPPDIPAQPDVAYGKEWTDWRDFLGALSEKEDMVRFVKEFKENLSKDKNNPFPPDEFVTNTGYKLGNKIRGLLGSYKNNVIPVWKKEFIDKELMDKNLFHWEGRNSFIWEASYDAYHSFIKETGNEIPPAKIIYKGYSIGAWARTQRYKYFAMINKHSKTNKALTNYQYKKLKEINFNFTPSKQTSWDKGYKKYMPLVTKNKGVIPGNRKWISAQRAAYKKGTLSKEKIKLMEKVKYWSWDPFADRLERNLQELGSYILKTGNVNPGQKEVYGDWAVGSHITKLRLRYRENKLDKKTIKRLQDLKIKLKPTKVSGSRTFYD